jgi:hypothetical protein
MTAIKKTTTKSSKSPAPATSKTDKSKPATTKKAAASSAPVIAFTSPAPKVKSVATKPVTTSITAKIDVGFGNALYVRGEGPGLSWDRGVRMTCVGADTWAVSLGEATRPFALKFLINDVTWSVGPDFTVAPGASVTFSPGF